MCLLKDFLKENYQILKDLKDCKNSVDTIFSKVLKISKLDLFLHLNREITILEKEKIDSFIKRRKSHEPLEYIFEEVFFYNLNLDINNSVLIPRVETEYLVEIISKNFLNKFKSLKNLKLLDLCSGSGAIGLSLKKEFSDLNVYLADISQKAIDLSRKNAKKNNLLVNFIKTDLFSNIFEKFDFIICNPPYISEKDFLNLDKSVKDFEPKLALVSHPSGLEFYEKLSNEIFSYLKPSGKLFLEMGFDQYEEVNKFFFNKKIKQKEVFLDLSYVKRFFFVEIE